MANKHKVLHLCAEHPELNSTEIAAKLGCMPEYVRATLSRARAAPKVKKSAGTRDTWSKEDLAKLMTMRAEKVRWEVISKELGRPLSSCAHRHREELQGRLDPRRLVVERPRHIPDAIMVDAIKRNTAPRSITSFLCGDPAPGQSALDKKQGAYA